MNTLQPINDNIIQPMTNYVYEHPYIATATGVAAVTGGVVFLGTGGIAAASVQAITLVKGGVAASCTFVKAHYILVTGVTLSFTKPYWEPTATTALTVVEDLYTNHKYMATAAGFTLTAGALYFGGKGVILKGASIFWENLKNTFVSKVGWGMLGTTALTIASSSYLLGTKDASEIQKQCLDQTLAIELPIDITFESNTGLVYVPALGFFSSCMVRGTARKYFLDDDVKNYFKIFSVGFGSGVSGGALKYGAKAFAYGENWKAVVVKSIVGAFNHGTYGGSAAFAKKDFISSEMDALTSLVAEPVDVATECYAKKGVVGDNPEVKLTDFCDAFITGIIMYNYGELVLPIVEKITSKIFNIFSTAESITVQTVDDTAICLVGENATLDYSKAL